MDAQEIFDIVARHLLKQNARSSRMNTCRYRGNNGMKCAIGVLIADDKYDWHLEARPVWDSRVQAALPSEVRDHPRLLRTLQLIHDQCEPETWLVSLKACAVQYNLEWRL